MYRRLTETQILAWADQYREAMGRWPTKRSGRIAGTVCETWAIVDRALRLGGFGLPGGSSLADLLMRERGARYASFASPLTEELILGWCDYHCRETGDWPTCGSGRVLGVPFERWANINSALQQGCRGLPGGSSLAKLLAERRGVRNLAGLPDLSEEQILAWADAWHQRTGKWPTEQSGVIPDSGGETWSGITTALQRGTRGLAGGTTLARLLAQRRGVRNGKDVPNLDDAIILSWVDAHRQQKGEWPTTRSGPILDAPGETWAGINAALVRGTRGLPGGTTLARFLAERRGRRNHLALPRLRPGQIQVWAEAHFRRTGEWPTADSGEIPEAPGETWLRVEHALRDGLRGLPGGSSLAQFLAERCGKRNVQDLPPLTQLQILGWIDAHRERKGEWPTRNSGPIPEAPGETWSGVDTALRDGLRGQPGGKSLARLLAQKRGVRNSKRLPPLAIDEILGWIDRHREQKGCWPTNKSGSIPGTLGETWLTVDKALRRGTRGLPGGSSLATLLREHRGKRNHKLAPPLTSQEIRAWAEAYRLVNGRLPTTTSGPIPEAPGETWGSVEGALRDGRRGMPGGSSLARFLKQITEEGFGEAGGA